MIPNRNRNIVIKSQFNIGGSRGRSVKPFISEYVSRESACDPSTGYLADPNKQPVVGDGVAFTMDASAIDRDEVLRLADHVEEHFQDGNRAIQQMVISFDPDYLIESGLVDEDTRIVSRGDYRGQYDDVRLRHAVREGMQSLIDAEGYRDAQMVAAIQYDTTHLHVHAVLYEDYPKLARMRGKEEKGVIKESSFHQMAYDMERSLERTRGVCVSEKKLLPKRSEKIEEESISINEQTSEMWNQYVALLYQRMKEREEVLDKLQAELDAFEDVDEDDDEEMSSTGNNRHFYSQVVK